MIKLVDLLHISKDDYSKYKIHFATGANDKMEPYNKFLIGEFKDWQEHQTNKNFSRQYVISLIYYSKNVWMFGGIYEIKQNPTLVTINYRDLWKYNSRLLDVEQDLIGRAFFYYKKEFRASYPGLDLQSQNSMKPSEMRISHILDKKVSLNDFPGFDQVNINYETLKLIIDDEIQSWKSVLSNVKGIYLIVDTVTGKQYVGSAYGDECIWRRWVNYATNGHGGNKKLKELLTTNGFQYRYNFKYSILEVCNMSLGNEYIISRESHWKEVLMTRQFGLNDN